MSIEVTSAGNLRQVSVLVDLQHGLSEETIEQTRLFAKKIPELVRLFAAKQEAYGRHNISKFGEMGVVIRAHDKTERLINILFGERADLVEDDSVRDAWRDLAVYGVIGLLLHDKEW